MTTIPRLTYFDFHGRAEPIRLAFHIGGIKFEDRRISHDEWQAMMPTSPSPALPFLEIGDTVLSQSQAILRYAGRLTGMYPDDDLLAAKVDEVLGVIEDILDEIVPTLLAQGEKQLEMRKNLVETSFPFWFERLDAKLAKNGGTFFVGNSLTIADIYMYSILKWVSSGILDGVPTTILDSRSFLRAFLSRLDASPKIKEWNEAHADPKPKLTYFVIKGRAEPIRLAFTVGGVDFEDIRITPDQWPSLKNKAPSGQLPFLQMGDEVFTQSLAILRLVGKKTGLYPLDPFAAFQVDEIFGIQEDIDHATIPLKRAPAEKKAEAKKKLLEEEIPPLLRTLEAKLTGDYFVGGSVTIADLLIYCTLGHFMAGDGTNPFIGLGVSNLLDSFPKLQQFMARLNSHPKVKQWNETHP